MFITSQKDYSFIMEKDRQTQYYPLVITYTLKNKQKVFDKIWGQFIQYVTVNDLSYLMIETEI